MITNLVVFVGNIVKTVIGAILAFVFIFIPTVTSNADEQIQYIEKDLVIDVPSEYATIDYYADNLGFDETIEITLQFKDEQFTYLIEQIETEAINQNGSWQKTEKGYEFEIEGNFLENNRYWFETEINKNTKQLHYKYLAL